MTLETCPSARRILVILRQTGVGISRKEPQNWGVLGSRPFGLGCVYRHILLPRVLPPRLWPLLVRAYDMENRRKKTGLFAPRFSKSLNVTGTDGDRLGTHDFLLTFHGPILHRFQAR